MFRLLFRFLVLLLLFALLRYVISAVGRMFSRAMNPHPPPQRANETTQAATGGELKQDPVCGTFVPITTSVKKTVNGELIHFCSAACRDKFKVAS
jgi:uncharacterized protein